MTKPVSTKKALLFIFLTVAINSMGIGLIMPVMPQLLAELTNEPVNIAAKWGGALTLVYALMQFLCGPTLGNLSDRFGRRPVLLIAMLVLAADYLIMALSTSLAILFAGRIMSGMAGATFSSASAYIADVSSPEDRAKNFGIIGAGFGVGFVVGPAIGGLLGELGPRAPFFAAAALSLTNAVYGYLVLPETLSPEKRRAFDWRRANPFGALKQISKFPTVVALLFAIFLFDIAHYVYPAVWSYHSELVFGWGPGEIGASLAAVGVGFALVQGWLIRIVEPKFGPAKTLLIALTANGCALVGLAFATTGFHAYLFMPFAALGAMATPAFTGLMANDIPDDAQGELQGIISSVAGISMIVSPLLMTQLFGYFASDDAVVYFPGAPYMMAAILSVIAIAIVIAALFRSRTAQTEGAE